MFWLMLAIPVGLLCLLIAVVAGPAFAAIFNTSLAVGYLIYAGIALLTIAITLWAINRRT